jgi:hypothetical protein
MIAQRVENIPHAPFLQFVGARPQHTGVIETRAIDVVHPLLDLLPAEAPVFKLFYFVDDVEHYLPVPGEFALPAGITVPRHIPVHTERLEKS